MDIKFYYNQSDDRTINKALTDESIYSGALRDEANIMNPTIRFRNADVMRFNYCYIPDFQRYYSVSSVNATRDGFYDVTLTVDVLMSFRGDIMNLTAIVDKQTDISNGDEYIDDSSLVTEALMFSDVYNFPNGFNDTPELILITAG